VQLENIRTFDFVAERLDRGSLKMNGWVFKIATGEVFDYDPVAEQFLLLAGAAADPLGAFRPVTVPPR
jgi:carbonic anhydrase